MIVRTSIKLIVLNILLFILSLTFLRSLLIMIVGKSIFKKAKHNTKNVYFPILNLFTMLDVLDISIFYAILLFIPVVNLYPLTLMSYKLGKDFNVSKPFMIGLILCPVVFYYILSKKDYKFRMNKDDAFKTLDSSSSKMNLILEEKEEKIPIVEL